MNARSILALALALSLAACGDHDDAEAPPLPAPAAAPAATSEARQPTCPHDGDGVHVLADRITLDAPIAFDLYAGTVSDASWPGVDLVAQRLGPCRSEVETIEIQVHTDSMRMGAFNARQSQVIADALRARLIAQGVAAERVIACGYGESAPIADNTSAEGRAQNMRVEWHRVARGYACPSIGE